VLTASNAAGLAAQEAAPAAERQDTVREAVRLRNPGPLAPAVRGLYAGIARPPAAASGVGRPPHTLNGRGERDRARPPYETALSRHPDDTRLRLEYGQMLVDTRNDRRAREVLSPAAETPAGAAGAETLLGTSAYWSGDFTRAAVHFRRALQADSSAHEARRQWREIAAATAPWVRFGSAGRHDDQPLDRIAPELEAGLFLTPLWSIRARGEAAWYRPEPDPSRSVLTAAATTSGYLPSLRLDTEASGGFVRRNGPTARTTAVGSLALRLRLPGHVSLGARGERKPYFFTTASLTTDVMIDEGAVTLALQHPQGWLGEGAYVRQRFSDRNTVESAYAWLLAPIARGSAVTFQAGYALSAQHARESRFVLADTTQAVPPGHPLFDVTGRYVPYYTPDHLLAHAALAALELRTTAGGRFRIDASLALHARDDAPVFQVSGVPPAVVSGTFRRAFTPWQLRGGVEQRVTPGLTFYVNAEHSRTVFYSTSGGSVSLMYRFASAAVRKVDRF
jgi:hypothetical protein